MQDEKLEHKIKMDSMDLVHGCGYIENSSQAKKLGKERDGGFRREKTCMYVFFVKAVAVTWDMKSSMTW